jgi:hypothetical protein
MITTTNCLDSNAICNPVGKDGNEINPNSLLNKIGAYGNPLSANTFALHRLESIGTERSSLT